MLVRRKPSDECLPRWFGNPIRRRKQFSQFANTRAHQLQRQHFIFNNYGHLYNGFAATTTINGGICPTGWHVPTELDWVELEAFLYAAGQGERMGTALKSTDSWSGNGNGEDLFGFGGIGGGHAWPDGNFTATTSGELTGAQQRQMQRQTARITVNSEIQLTRWRAARIGPLPDAVCVALKTDNPSNQKEEGNLAVPFFISPLPPLSRSGISFVF